MKRLPKGIIKVAKPKMTNTRGRTWDSLSIILLDGTKLTGYMDFTWGRYFYFEMDQQWYRGSNLTWELNEAYCINFNK